MAGEPRIPRTTSQGEIIPACEVLMEDFLAGGRVAYRRGSSRRAAPRLDSRYGILRCSIVDLEGATRPSVYVALPPTDPRNLAKLEYIFIDGTDGIGGKLLELLRGVDISHV